MKAKRFCELIELAIREEYGTESNFDTVPYLSEEAGASSQECLGVFLTEDVHMGPVAARAQAILVLQLASGDNDPAKGNENILLEFGRDVVDETNEFADIMGAMRIAPYMQWHCAYFPGLTEAQVLADAEAFDASAERLDTSGTGAEVAGMPAEQFFEELHNVAPDDGMVRWYSGRGMYGRECVAISGSNGDCIAAISTVRERANEVTLIAMNDVRTDSLGNDIVMYFPNFLRQNADGRIDPVDGSFVPN